MCCILFVPSGWVNTYLNHNYNYEGWLKTSLADQDTFIEWDQMWFIFLIFCDPHIFSSVLQCLDPHWSSKLSTADMTSAYEFFSPASCIMYFFNCTVIESIISNRIYNLVWFGWFYGISTFVGYLTPNPFLCK